MGQSTGRQTNLRSIEERELSLHGGAVKGGEAEPGDRSVPNTLLHTLHVCTYIHSMTAQYRVPFPFSEM